MNKLKVLPTFIILSLALTFSSFVSAQNSIGIEKNVNINNDDMTKARHYTNVVDGYLRGLNEKDLEGILSLYAENATVEDPVGSKVLNGKAALREFYTGAVGIDLRLTRTGPVRVAGIEVAFPFQLRMKVNGIPIITDIIDVFRFDEAGKIVSMRAFWGPDNQRPAAE